MEGCSFVIPVHNVLTRTSSQIYFWIVRQTSRRVTAYEGLPTDRSEESNLLDRIIASCSFARRASHLRFAALSKSERTSRTYLLLKGPGFDRGHPDVLLRPTDHGSNVHSSRTANSERATTRNATAMAILHRRSESGASMGEGGKEIKNSEHKSARGVKRKGRKMLPGLLDEA